MGVIEGTATGTDSVLSLRELIQLGLLGVFALLLQRRVFADNPSSRRVLLMGVAVALAVLPLSFAGSPLQIPLPLDVPSVVGGDLSFPAWFVLLLLIPGLVRVGLLLGGVIRRQLRLSRHQAPVDPQLARAIEAAVQGLRLNKPVRVVVSGSEGPASGTLLGPVLVLPQSAAEWSDSTLQAVLAHEFVHLRRRDDLWVLLIRLVVAFYWWMPWLRPLEVRLIEAIEESCDDAAGALSGDICYLEGMVDVARRHTQERSTILPAAGFVGMAWLRESHLLARMRRFSESRLLEVDSRGVYWSLLTLVTVSMLVAGIQPVPAIATPAFAETLLTAPSTLRVPLMRGAETFGVDVRVDTRGTHSALSTRLADTRRVIVPQYPGRALTNAISGDVAVGFELAADGSVVLPKVVEGSHALLNRAALDAAMQSRFPPLHAIPVLQLESPQFRAGTGSAQKARLIYRFRTRSDASGLDPEQPSGE